eukprot:scaffold7066_cov253-Pinguiococcus_pyrenoidosus.AAC.7
MASHETGLSCGACVHRALNGWEVRCGALSLHRFQFPAASVEFRVHRALGDRRSSPHHWFLAFTAQRWEAAQARLRPGARIVIRIFHHRPVPPTHVPNANLTRVHSKSAMSVIGRSLPAFLNTVVPSTPDASRSARLLDTSVSSVHRRRSLRRAPQFLVLLLSYSLLRKVDEDSSVSPGPRGRVFAQTLLPYRNTLIPVPPEVSALVGQLLPMAQAQLILLLLRLPLVGTEHGRVMPMHHLASRVSVHHPLVKIGLQLTSGHIRGRLGSTGTGTGIGIGNSRRRAKRGRGLFCAMCIAHDGALPSCRTQRTVSTMRRGNTDSIEGNGNGNGNGTGTGTGTHNLKVLTVQVLCSGIAAALRRRCASTVGLGVGWHGQLLEGLSVQEAAIHGG